MNLPKLLSKAWATSGSKNAIPTNRTSSLSQGSATYDEGFPTITMTPIAQGGKAPSGKDMNGILNEITEHIVYQNKGGAYTFNSDFAAEISGYEKGAVLISDDYTKFMVSLIDNNTVNFNTSDYEKTWAIIATTNLVKYMTPKDLDESSTSATSSTGHSHKLPLATLEKKGIVKLLSGVDSNDETMAATPKSVKTAYDKGVEAKTAADNANSNANGRVSKSGDTMTGMLSIKSGDYSSVNQFNLSGKFSRIEAMPDDQTSFYKLSYRSDDAELHTALFPKSGTAKVVAYEDWVNNGYVPRTGDTLINGHLVFEGDDSFITIKSTGKNQAAIDYKVWNSSVPLVTAQAADLGNFSCAFNIFTTPEGTDYSTDRREKTAQIHHDGRIWSKNYGWLDEKFALASDTHKKSRCHNHWFSSHYAGSEVVDLPVDDTGGIRITWMGIKLTDYRPPYVDIYLPMTYDGFIKAVVSDDGSAAYTYGAEVIGNNIVRVYYKQAASIGFTLQVIGWASF